MKILRYLGWWLGAVVAVACASVAVSIIAMLLVAVIKNWDVVQFWLRGFLGS